MASNQSDFETSALRRPSLTPTDRQWRPRETTSRPSPHNIAATAGPELVSASPEWLRLGFVFSRPANVTGRAWFPGFPGSLADRVGNDGTRRDAANAPPTPHARDATPRGLPGPDPPLSSPALASPGPLPDVPNPAAPEMAMPLSDPLLDARGSDDSQTPVPGRCSFAAGPVCRSRRTGPASNFGSPSRSDRPLHATHRPFRATGVVGSRRGCSRRARW